MDPSHYKDTTVHGVQYRYYFVAPTAPNKPYLFFLHGFPSTSEHWVHQVVYFSTKGYGIIAPDMLGYGGTAKLEDPKVYDRVVIAEHMAAILDKEGINKVVVIGHDWGSTVASRLANLYPERHLASIFTSVAYMPPSPDRDFASTIEFAKKTLGEDIFSYMKFFSSQGAPQLIAAHEDSFYSLLFTSDPEHWRKHLAPDGALEKWLLADKRAPIESWAPDRKRHDEAFRAGGWIAPLNWYKSHVNGIVSEGDKLIPKDRYQVHHPVLLIATTHDMIARANMAKAVAEQSCTNLTVRELDTGHWGMLEKPEEYNAIMDEYLQTLLNV